MPAAQDARPFVQTATVLCFSARTPPLGLLKIVPVPINTSQADSPLPELDYLSTYHVRICGFHFATRPTLYDYTINQSAGLIWCALNSQELLNQGAPVSFQNLSTNCVSCCSSESFLSFDHISREVICEMLMAQFI